MIDLRSGKAWEPFRVAVVADLHPRSAFALRCPSAPRHDSLSLQRYDRLLAQVEPAFRLDINDPRSGREVPIDVRWRQWGDVTGAGLVSSPTIAAMCDALASLVRGAPGLEPYRYVDRVLPDNQDWLNRQPRSTGDDPRASQGRDEDPLSALFDLVDLPSNAPGSSQDFAPAVLGLRAELSQVLCAALAHPEYRRLRRVWKSLRELATSKGDHRLVEIDVISNVVHPEELGEALNSVEADLVVFEDPFEPCARDAETLKLLAEWAAEHSTPIIATLDSSWVVEPDCRVSTSQLRLAEVSRSLLDAIAGRDPSRWLLLALNDLCDSEPATGELVRGGPSCEQPRNEESSWTFLPAGIAVTTLVISSMARGGEPFFSDAADASQLRSRALHEVGPLAERMAVGTRQFCTDQMASDLERLGICLLVPSKNRDRVRVTACPTAHRPRTSSGDLGSPASTLRDQILVGRIARALSHARLSLGEGADPTSVSAQLESYVCSLFPHAPPVGPFVDVACVDGTLTVDVQPRRYAQLTLERLALSVSLT